MAIERKAWFVAIAVTVLAVGSLVWLGLEYYISLADSKERKDSALLFVQTMGVIALLLGGYLTFRRVRAAEDTVRIAEEGPITERFTRAIDQLGSDKLPVCLGGIYALERIAKGSEQDHWPIMEVLTAYIRDRASVSDEEKVKEDVKDEGRPSPKVASDIQAILTVIGRRRELWRRLETERLDLAEASLAGSDLFRAHLEKAFLIRAHLEGANLIEANLEEAYLIEANLRWAKLTEANLKWAKLTWANLELAGLDHAELRGAHLAGANLKDAFLAGANLENAFLAEANLEGAKLTGAKLEGAFLAGAKLEGADFTGAKLEGANLTETGLTQYQIDTAFHDRNTMLPDHL